MVTHRKALIPSRALGAGVLGLILLLVASCTDVATPTAAPDSPDRSAPAAGSFSESSASDANAVAEALGESLGEADGKAEGAVAFLEPLGPGLPADFGPVTTDLSPVVEVCAVQACDAPLTTFSGDGRGNARVRVVTDSDPDGPDHFIVHWRPADSGLRGGETVHIRVRHGDAVLGSTRVRVAAPGPPARDGAQDVPVVMLPQAVAIRFAVSAGGEAPDPDEPPVNDDYASAVIGAAGGSLALPGASLVIPSGALDAPVEIGMARLADPTSASFLFVPGTGVSFSPSGLQFSTPAVFTLTFDPELLPAGLDAGAVAIHRLNPDGSTTPLPTTVELAAGSATAFLDGFSQYIVIVTLPGTLTWVGGASPDPRDWHTAANWSPAVVPTPTFDVLVPAGGEHHPRITRRAESRALRILEGASLELAGAGIEVHGILAADGPVTGTVGSVVLEGEGTQPARGTVPALWVARGAATLSGTLRVTGDLQVNGPGASLEVGAHTLLVDGNLETVGTFGRLLMDDLQSRVTVLGNARFSGGTGGEASLLRGVLTLHGDLRQDQRPDALRASGNHLVRFAGTGTEQVVNLGHPGAGGSRLANVETLNPGQVTFTQGGHMTALSWGDAGIGGRVVVQSGTLEATTVFLRGPLLAPELRVYGVLAAASGVPYLVERTVFAGPTGTLPWQGIPDLDYLDLVVEGSDVRVGDPWVRVRRSLLVDAGTLRIQGNVLEVQGGIRASQGAAGGILRMDAGDRVLAWHVDLRTANPQFAGGTLWIQGDLVGRSTIVGTGRDHRTVFHGVSTQEIVGAGGFALGQLVLANTGDGVRIRTPALQASGADAAQRFLELVGNTRLMHDGNNRVSVGVAVFRATSRTHFASSTDRAFNCVWVFREDGSELTTEPGNTDVGCAVYGSAVAGPPALADFTPPSRLEVRIDEPASTATYNEGEPITFRASATLGGAPVAATYRWFSSRGGELGTGAVVVRNDLPAGPHLVEVRVDATAPDGSLIPGSASVLVIVSGEDDPPPAPPVLTSIDLSPTQDAIITGEATSFRARALDQYGLEMPEVEFTWKSSDECVATVSPSGVALGYSNGSVVVTVSAGDVSATANLAVGAVDPTLPTSVLGLWRVCRRNTGEFLYTVDVTEQEEGGRITGRVFHPGGTSSFMSGNWGPTMYNMQWSRLIQGGERVFGINGMGALSMDHLRGSYNDRLALSTYDVELRRTR